MIFIHQNANFPLFADKSTGLKLLCFESSICLLWDPSWKAKINGFEIDKLKHVQHDSRRIKKKLSSENCHEMVVILDLCFNSRKNYNKAKLRSRSINNEKNSQIDLVSDCVLHRAIAATVFIIIWHHLNNGTIKSLWSHEWKIIPITFSKANQERGEFEKEGRFLRKLHGRVGGILTSISAQQSQLIHVALNWLILIKRSINSYLSRNLFFKR